jgi:hypothetical protein
MVSLVKKPTKKTMFFCMAHAISQSKHPFGQCKHFNQIEPFEKP